MTNYVDRAGVTRWRFAVRDGVLTVDVGECLWYGLAPATVFGFGTGTFSQTRWRFSRHDGRGTVRAPPPLDQNRTRTGRPPWTSVT